MAISEKIKQGIAHNSHIRRMAEESLSLKRKYGNDKVYDLTVSSPLMEPPEAFSRELKKLMEAPRPGMHRYMENAGYTDTRAAVAAQLEVETGIKFKWNEVIMTSGAAGALNSVFKTLLNPGEEIIVFAPFFFEYKPYIDNHSGVCKIVPSDENFIPDFKALETAITPITKGIVINSPNDPTGVVYNAEILKKIAAIADKKSLQYKTRIYIISDDVYNKYFYAGGKCPRILHYYPHTIVVSSYSKDLYLPGERIGYLAVHPDCEDIQNVVGGLIYTFRTLGFVNASALMQNVVRSLQNYSVPVAEFKRKRDFLFDNLTQMGYSMVKPQGAFYLFPHTPIKDDLIFTDELKKLLVLTVPGSTFKAPGYMRISYSLDDRTLEGSLEGFRRAIEKYKR